MQELGKTQGKEEIDAVFIYGGILDAYEAVGIELIGPTVLEEHVLPKMVYYVQEFLPEIFSERAKDPETLTADLKAFLDQYRDKIEQAREQGTAHDYFTMNEIWQLRAAIFGYESAFIDILGEAAIKTYMFKRIADILSAYLPDAFVEEKIMLKEKLDAYVKYIQEKDFVRYANYKISKDLVTITANRCAFSKIHDSEAYRNANVRFCPWGMVGSAILASHLGKETTIDSCFFTTKGSVSKIVSK